MRVFDNGCFYTVKISCREVEDFKTRWPCSGLPSRSVRFQFSKRNGDLVDLHPSTLDGSAALALSQDAQAYSRQRLRGAAP
jgi:hypothetical protein